MTGKRLGPYEIVDKLGAGGMGEVFKARDTRLNRTVAVKTMPPLLAGAADWRERFEREGRAISQLSHPHICTLFDVGEQDGVAYLVMEHLDGETLADRLARGPIPVEQAVAWATQIAGALHAAHRHGILHRDLKPGNIMVTAAGIKLLDFGLAKMVAGRADAVESVTAPPTRSVPLTAQGTILGTFQYMAPEVIEGEEADVRADIWAFGCVLYEMLTGRRAFAGKSQASLFGAILKEEAPSVSAAQPLASPALDRIVRTCLAKDPNQRVQNAHDLLLNLQWVAEGGSAAGVAAPVLARRHSRQRLLWTMLAVGVGAISATAAWVAKPAPATSSIVTRFVHTLDSTVRFSRTGRRSLAVAPDGSFFVYVANAQLFVRRMNDIAAQPIKGTDEDPMDPIVSPDGQWVAYFVPVSAGAVTTLTGTAVPATLKKIPVTGGAPVVLATLSFPYGVHWLGDTLVVGQGAPGVVAVPAGGGTPQPVVALHEDEVGAGSPHLANGGRSLLFTTLKKGTSDWNRGTIFWQPLAGGERRVVVEGGYDGRVLPNGHLVYMRDGTLFAAPFDDTTGTRTGDPVPLVVGVFQAGVSGEGHFSVSGDGRLTYLPAPVTPTVIRRTLVWVDRQGREQPIPADAREYIYGRVSPNNRRLALDALGGRRDLWIFDLERDILTRLTQEDDTADKRAPTWSADGQSLFYTATTADKSGLVRRSASGTGASTRLGDEPSSQVATNAVTPDGGTLVYSLQIDGDNYDLKVMPLTGGGAPQSIASSPRRETNAHLSPDGRWLAYESNESGRLEIYVRPFPAVDAGRWQVSSAGGTRAVWARNGRELHYVDGAGQMMAVAVSGSGSELAYGRPTALFATAPFYMGTHPGRATLIGRTFDVAPDGRFLMIKQPPGAVAPDTQSVVVVEHWLDEVRQRLGR